jgi:hypothetical protein
MAKSETLSEARQKFEEWAVKHLGDDRYLIRDVREPDKYDAYLMDHLWLAWQDSRLQGLEEAARAICQWCAQGNQADRYTRGWHHAIGSGNLPCAAAAIREKANE